MIVAAGFALGASDPVRQIGEILILPTVIYLLVVIPGWRAKLTTAATICAAFALPILAVSYRDYVAIKHFALTPYAQATIYGRAAAVCLVNVLAAAAVLLGSDVFEFSWRYQLPALVTLVPAGALGITVVIGFLTARRGQLAGPPVSPQPVRPAPTLSDEHPGLQAKDRASAG